LSTTHHSPTTAFFISQLASAAVTDVRTKKDCKDWKKIATTHQQINLPGAEQ
jgi:hypothetical protein